LSDHTTIHHGCWYSSRDNCFVTIPAEELLAKHQKVHDGQVHRQRRVDPAGSATAAPEHASLAPLQNTRLRTTRRKEARVVQTRFIPPWIMLLSRVPMEDQEDVTKMEGASPSPVFSRPPGFPNAGVIDPESSWPGTATSADWFSEPDDLAGPCQFCLDSEEVELDAGDEPTSVEEDSLVDVTIPPSFQTVACSVVLQDISKLLHEVPSTQPQR